MIQIKNLHKTYGNKKNLFEALKGININIENGESVAIVGKSGSGKSTLMHLLAGLDKPTSGEIIIDGENLYSLKKHSIDQFRNKKFGFIFQQFFLNPRDNCLENVILPLKIRGISKKDRKQKGLKALEEVDLLDKAKSNANDLSGGQKQRVCIARALVAEPEIIFADEPTGNLDSETGARVITTLFDLNKNKNITLIIVTHDEDLANLCDRKIYIKDGIIIKEDHKQNENIRYN
jgi:putative ABC transport system ATP-binding protein